MAAVISQVPRVLKRLEGYNNLPSKSKRSTRTLESLRSYNNPGNVELFEKKKKKRLSKISLKGAEACANLLAQDNLPIEDTDSDDPDDYLPLTVFQKRSDLTKKERNSLLRRSQWLRDRDLSYHIHRPLDQQTWSEWVAIIIFHIQDRLPLYREAIKPRIYTRKFPFPPRIMTAIAKFKEPLATIRKSGEWIAYTVRFQTLSSFSELLSAYGNRIQNDDWSHRSRGNAGSKSVAKVWDTAEKWRGMEGGEIRIRWRMVRKQSTDDRYFETGMIQLSFFHYLEGDVTCRRHVNNIERNMKKGDTSKVTYGGDEATSSSQRVVSAEEKLAETQEAAHQAEVDADDEELDALLDSMQP